MSVSSFTIPSPPPPSKAPTPGFATMLYLLVKPPVLISIGRLLTMVLEVTQEGSQNESFRSINCLAVAGTSPLGIQCVTRKQEHPALTRHLSLTGFISMQVKYLRLFSVW